MYNLNPDRVGKLLVIDDDPAIGKLIKKFLEHKGYYVDTALNGKDGLAKIASESYDIVITDIKMPGMDGMAVLDKIKEINNDIDVIVITGFGSIESAVSFMRAGALDYIIKPINRGYLEIVIEKAIERKELIQASRERDIYLKLSLTDALTGTFNHKYFQEHLERQLMFAQRKNNDLSIMMVDIDNFKMINDKYGHQTGDMVLQQVSSNIIKACRTHDTVARYGGEEFGIILPDTHIDKSKSVAFRILETISAQKFKPLNYAVTVSIGISSFPQHPGDKAELIKKADIALYYSKEKGKNRYTVFDEKMGALISR